MYNVIFNYYMFLDVILKLINNGLVIGDETAEAAQTILGYCNFSSNHMQQRMWVIRLNIFIFYQCYI